MPKFILFPLILIFIFQNANGEFVPIENKDCVISIQIGCENQNEFVSINAAANDIKDILSNSNNRNSVSVKNLGENCSKPIIDQNYDLLLYLYPRQKDPDKKCMRIIRPKSPNQVVDFASAMGLIQTRDAWTSRNDELCVNWDYTVFTTAFKKKKIIEPCSKMTSASAPPASSHRPGVRPGQISR